MTVTEHRSFPEAADGRPALPMEPELWAAGCDLETARFVARHLDAQGYTLIRAEDIERIEAENKRLREGPKVKPLVWDQDGRRLRLDDTLIMGKGYDWDGYEVMRQEAYGLGCGYIIWPDRISSKVFSVYGTADGLYMQNIDGEDEAKAAAQADYKARILSAITNAGQ